MPGKNSVTDVDTNMVDIYTFTGVGTHLGELTPRSTLIVTSAALELCLPQLYILV